jgi:hypothetical protein
MELVRFGIKGYRLGDGLCCLNKDWRKIVLTDVDAKQANNN